MTATVDVAWRALRCRRLSRIVWSSRLNIGRTLIYELIGAGALEVIHIGRAVRVPADALFDFVERRRTDEQSRLARRVDSKVLWGPASASPCDESGDCGR